MNNKNPSKLEFDNFCEKFDIEKHAKSYINSQAFLDTGIKKRLSEDGYVILKNVVSKKILEEVRRYWLNPEIKKSRKLVQNQNTISLMTMYQNHQSIVGAAMDTYYTLTG